MTIPTREEALKVLDKLSSDYDLAGGWSPDPMPLLATLRSYIESHTGEVLAHEWHERFGLTCCKVCGFVRNENSDAKGCRGPVYVSLRDASPVQPVKLEWQPIETCPKDEQYYLMTRGLYPSLATWDDQDEEWFSFNGDYERTHKKPFRPTHWMPCPPPAPKGDK